MKKLIFPLILLILAVSCKPVKLAVPAQFSSNATEIPVKGLNSPMIFGQKKGITFGKYKTSKIKTGIMKEVTSTGLLTGLFNSDGGTTHSKKQSSKYEYTLEDGQLKSSIFCKEYKWNDPAVFSDNKGFSVEISGNQENQYSFMAAITLQQSDKDELWKVLLVTEDYADSASKKNSSEFLKFMREAMPVMEQTRLRSEPSELKI